jgi:heterodisulfide reductase subunit B
MIAAVQGKYGDKKSTLNNQVLRMCNEVKRAINALYYDSMDEVADALNSFRTIDTQTTKAVLDVVLEKTNVQSIGHYYPSNSGFITIEIANKIKGFNGAIYENMKNLHELINACSHNVYNKQDLKEKNDVTKEEFLKLDKEKQKEIITALVRFYQILELTETQKNKIKEIVKQF